MPNTTLPPTWKRLADDSGGVAKLAEKLGVDPRTLYRWAHGVCRISGPARILLAQLAGRPVLPGE